MGEYDGPCEAGCMSFHGGEKKHHRDCGHYPASLTKLWHDTEAEYGRELAALRKERDALAARVEVLEGALRPFVKSERGVLSLIPGTAFANARAALEGKE